jgi:hypothetical protein
MRAETARRSPQCGADRVGTIKRLKFAAASI